MDRKEQSCSRRMVASGSENSSKNVSIVTVMVWKFLKRIYETIPEYLNVFRLIYIILFGIFGVVLRYFVYVLVGDVWKIDLFWGTFIVNMIGSVGIGIVFVAGIEKSFISKDLSTGLMVGLLGGFTTFSQYYLDSFQLWQSKNWVFSFLYVFLTPIFGIGLISLTIYVFRSALVRLSK